MKVLEGRIIINQVLPSLAETHLTRSVFHIETGEVQKLSVGVLFVSFGNLVDFGVAAGPDEFATIVP